jgi:hypothetical protein
MDASAVLSLLNTSHDDSFVSVGDEISSSASDYTSTDNDDSGDIASDTSQVNSLVTTDALQDVTIIGRGRGRGRGRGTRGRGLGRAVGIGTVNNLWTNVNGNNTICL